MSPSDNSRKNSGNRGSEENFVLVDTDHPGIGNIDFPETEVRRVDRPIPGNRQGADQGSRQGGESPGTEGGAPGPESSSGV